MKLSRSKREIDENIARSRDVEGENEPPEGDSKYKNKFMSLWNNMKYGWMVNTKTNFSKDSPVWLLGKCYHRKMILDTTERNTSRGMEDNGIEGFKSDFISRIWLTYRREFPILNGSHFTTDCGWGCMLRSGQMLLAQGLVCHFLGRGWRWRDEAPISAGLYNEEVNHRKIIKWFGDNPSHNSPFSIHMLVKLGEPAGKRPGDWYGPSSVSYLLRQAVELAGKDNQEFQHLCVYVAQDCAVYTRDILDLCESKQLKAKDVSKSSKAMILLVPLRLGAEKLNATYAPQLTNFLTLESCIGIIGGRPKHAVYFVGYQDDKLIHLDPHYCQETVDVWRPNFPLWSFHCRHPRKMNLSKFDPSCCVGFYFKTLEEYLEFKDMIENSPDWRSENLPFVFCEGRSQDAIPNNFSISDNVVEHSAFELHDADDLESEEFDFL